MSYSMWSVDGRGICVHSLKKVTVDGVFRLLEKAPKTKTKVLGYLKDCNVKQADATLEDIAEMEDSCGYMGIGTILRDVIEEAEDVLLDVCEDCDCKQYLLFTPFYPWSNVSDAKRSMTKERLDEIFEEYVGLLTDEYIEVCEYSVPNCG